MFVLHFHLFVINRCALAALLKDLGLTARFLIHVYSNQTHTRNKHDALLLINMYCQYLA